jgi:hypothetical protein
VLDQDEQDKWEAEKSAVHNFQQKFYRRNGNTKKKVKTVRISRFELVLLPQFT